MSTKTVMSPRELGKRAFDEVRGHKPLMDDVFVENYLTDKYHIAEQFKSMREWFSGYKNASYDFNEKHRKKNKTSKKSHDTYKSQTKVKNKTIVMDDGTLPF